MIKLAGWITGVSFVIVIGVTGAHAQATRTWVSGVGDDANPCSRTAPCKTFAGAISKTAAGGEIDVLDPGGFGAVTITKAITIDGSGGSIAGVLVPGTNGIVVAAGATDVVILRNLGINGAGSGLTGIQFNTGGMLYIENSQIYGFLQNGINFWPSGASQLSIDKSVIRQSLIGLSVKPGATGSASVMVAGSRIEHNSGAGVRAQDGSEITITGSVASSNGGNGFVAFSAANPVEINLEGCVCNNNGATGVVATGAGAIVRMSNTTVTQNATGLSGNVFSFGNNRIAGNTANGTLAGSISQQ